MRTTIFKRFFLFFFFSLFSLPLFHPFSARAIEDSPRSGFFFPWDYRNGTATMGTREIPIHNGHAFDVIRSGTNMEILAPKAGYVVFTKDTTPDDWRGDCDSMEAANNYIVLGHGPRKDDETFEFYTAYYHVMQGSITVSPGDRVTLGQRIGMTGSAGRTGGRTGIHLHFFGSTGHPSESLEDSLRCSGNGLTLNQEHGLNNKTISFSGSTTVGFEEEENEWSGISSMQKLQAFTPSWNYEGHLGTNCNPDTAEVILYEHIDYGGECFAINAVSNNIPLTNVPNNLGPGGLQVSSIYLNPDYFDDHLLHVYDVYNGPGSNTLVLDKSNPRLHNWNDIIKSLHNSSTTPSWLEEKSFAEQLPFEVDIHVEVDDPGDFDAMRVCFSGENCQETSATELNYTWNTYGWDDGSYIISIEYRVDSDSGNWANAEKYEQGFSLSPVRNGYAPCGASLDAVQLTSGSDCIKVTQDVSDMAPVGWADRSNLQACVDGEDWVVWLYDGVRDQYGNFPGSPHVVKDGECKNIGGNVSSLNIRSTEELPPIPETPYVVDPDTAHLYHFNEGTGTTLGDSTGTLNGTINASNWVSGKFGNALQFPNPTDGDAVTFGTMDICPITIEMWVKTSSSTGGRLAGQLGGGGNSGSNKWLLSLDGKKPKIEIWSAGGSIGTVSYREIEDDGWHHLMATYDCSSKKATLYQDGERVAEMTSAATWNSGATTFEIGAGEGIYKCNCSIDEVRISNVIRVPLPPPDWGLMPNGGFETLTSGWADNWTKDASSISIDTGANGKEGANSLKFTPHNSNAHVFAQNIDVEYQYNYEFGQYVKTTSGSGEFGFYIDEYDDENNWISGQWKGMVEGSHDDFVLFDYTPTSHDVAKASLQYYMVANTTFTAYVDYTTLYKNAGINLVANSSFESLTSGWANTWTRNNTSAVTVDTSSNGNDGTNSLRLTNHANHHHAFSDYIPVVTDAQYSLGQYVKASSGSGEFGFYIDEYDENHNWISGKWLGMIDEAVDDELYFSYTPTDEDVAFAAIQYYMTGGTTLGVYVDSVNFSRE